MLALLALMAHRGIAPAMLFALLALPGWARLRGDMSGFLRFSTPLKPAQIACLAVSMFYLWTGVSALWSPMPEKVDWSWRMGIAHVVLALGVYGFAVAGPHDAVRIKKAFAFGVVLMAALLAIEGASGGFFRATFGANDDPYVNFIAVGRGAVLLTLLVWPGYLVVEDLYGRVAARLFLTLVAVAVAFLPIDANVFAFGVGAAFFVAASIWPQRALDIVFFVLAAALLLNPVVAAVVPFEAAVYAGVDMGLPMSWVQRIMAWSTAGSEIAATFPLGGGVEYARFIARQDVYYDITSIDVSLRVMPMHPHNTFLHIWMDLGLIGAVCALGVIFSAWRAARNSVKNAASHAKAAAVIAGVVGAFLAYALTEWSLWQVWRITALWIAFLAIFISLKRV